LSHFSNLQVLRYSLNPERLNHFLMLRT
jgi:hypothetical protein